MLWYYLVRFVAWLKYLLGPVTARDVARVRASAPCPVCGAKNGTLRCVERQNTQGVNGRPAVMIVAQHTCGDCGARWFERPVLKLSQNMVWASIPRNEAEKTEDAQVVTNGVSSSSTSVTLVQ